jgi:hypothetical protein
MRAAFIALCAFLVTLAPASALPGQTLPAFRVWARGIVLLRGIQPYTDELSGQPAFQLTQSDHGINWHFTAWSLRGQIYQEYLGVGEGTGTPGSLRIRHDGTGYGFVFFKSLYGSGVASDFLAAKLVGTAVDRSVRPANTQSFYRGSRFGYELGTNGGGVSVVALFRLPGDLAQARRCDARPERCSE